MFPEGTGTVASTDQRLLVKVPAGSVAHGPPPPPRWCSPTAHYALVGWRTRSGPRRVRLSAGGHGGSTAGRSGVECSRPQQGRGKDTLLHGTTYPVRQPGFEDKFRAATGGRGRRGVGSLASEFSECVAVWWHRVRCSWRWARPTSATGVSPSSTRRALRADIRSGGGPHCADPCRSSTCSAMRCCGRCQSHLTCSARLRRPLSEPGAPHRQGRTDARLVGGTAVITGGTGMAGFGGGPSRGGSSSELRNLVLVSRRGGCSNCRLVARGGRRRCLELQVVACDARRIERRWPR